MKHPGKATLGEEDWVRQNQSGALEPWELRGQQGGLLGDEGSRGRLTLRDGVWKATSEPPHNPGENAIPGTAEYMWHARRGGFWELQE